MKKNKYTAILLLFVSVIMLTASFVPHHHHWHTICIKHLCESEQHHEEHNSCRVGCIVHFKCQQPQNHIELLPYGLPEAFLNDVTKLIPPIGSVRLPFLFAHTIILHPQWKVLIKGLRAPPYFS